MYDYEARWYDLAVGWFLGVDPMALDFAIWSTYHHALDNPILFIDPDGRAPELADPPVRIIVARAVPSKGDVGHAFVAIGNGENMVAYTYGRYAELGSNKGPLNGTNLSGQGVLIRLEGEEASALVDKYVDKYNANVYTVADADPGAVEAFFNEKFESSGLIPSVGAYADDDKARVIDQYDLLDNNCTTLSVQGVEAGLDDGELDYRKPIQHPKLRGIVRMFVVSISPSGLDSELNEASSNGLNENILKDEPYED